MIKNKCSEHCNTEVNNEDQTEFIKCRTEEGS